MSRNRSITGRSGKPTTASSADLARYPLLQRAWCFQERMLSSRTIYFTQTELIWECGQALQCECSGLDDIQQDFMLDERSAARGHPKRFKWKWSGMTANRMNQQTLLWRETVQAYTRLNITYDADRLPALAGMAEKMMLANKRPDNARSNLDRRVPYPAHTSRKPNSKAYDDGRRSQDVYMAGLWYNTLFADMTWYLSNDLLSTTTRSRRVRVPQWQAPSWSWACLSYEHSPDGVEFLAQGEELTADQRRQNHIDRVTRIENRTVRMTFEMDPEDDNRVVPVANDPDQLTRMIARIRESNMDEPRYMPMIKRVRCQPASQGKYTTGSLLSASVTIVARAFEAHVGYNGKWTEGSSDQDKYLLYRKPKGGGTGIWGGFLSTTKRTLKG